VEGMIQKRVLTTFALLACLALGGPAEAGEAGGRTGGFEAVFTERWPHSSLRHVLRRMQQELPPGSAAGLDYRIDQEKYSVYVPSDYSGDAAYGLVVWVSSGEKGDMPEGWSALMDKHKLIWIGAHRSGNEHNLYGRRMPLALDAVFNMTKKYNIDPNRVYVCGDSGGGRVASILAMHYAEVFSGGVFIVGAEYWEPVPVTGRPGHMWKPMPKPQSRYLAIARSRGRYVLLTGDHDANRAQTWDFYEKGYKRKLRHVLYIQVPSMGHETPPAQWYEKAIVFLDTAATAKENAAPQTEPD